MDAYPPQQAYIRLLLYNIPKLNNFIWHGIAGVESTLYSREESFYTPNSRHFDRSVLVVSCNWRWRLGSERKSVVLSGPVM
ncbi:hypothetical protein L873DRAFT_332195 [Choiromyces venosus 120613-1]|uniref:Uncharacterized protein n=1 Tax=Choiromyces venosus 120613-1 TaxID=1336337 RepID=A0A3N4IVI0_9PEZI|nr:hypothetical protein L873DRAFT_577777 [Choiromyces venosus 120613-1]RPB03003.1 hypothetical protein L873DRAFT_332195 [Choiromyces venosus 120613-1]